MIDKLNELADLLLPGVEPYWVLASESPPLWIDDAAGCTGRNLDIALRGWLEDSGRWRGRHPAIQLDDTHYQNTLKIPDVRGYAWREQLAASEHALAGVAVHELAHIIENGIDRSEVTASRGEIELAVSRFQAVTAAESIPSLDLHTPAWLRVAAHAHHRLLRAGLGIEPEKIFRGFNGSPPLANALFALGDELTELAGEPLGELAQHPFPSDYVGLWRFKLNQWRSTRADDDTAADRLVAEQLASLIGGA